MKVFASFVCAALAASLAWCHAHPAYVIMAVGAALSFAHDHLSAFPRIQALAKLAAGIGIDGPKIAGALTQLLTGAAPGSPPAIPPAATGALLCLSVALGGLGCAGASQASVASTAAQQADVAAYAAQEQACVANAKANDAGLAGAEACISAVQSYWCGDGGPLAGYCAGQTPAPVDGGGQ